MSDLSQKSSGELAEELQNLMPKLEGMCYGWKAFWLNGYALEPTRILNHVANLALAQQKEIEQLKAELKELKK